MNVIPAFKFTADEVHPFSEGFAVVGSGETFHWVDASGETGSASVAKWWNSPFGGTNFYDGKAYLWMRMKNSLYWKPMDECLKFLVENLWLIICIDLILISGWMCLMLPTEQDYGKQWIPEVRNGMWTYISAKGKPLTPFQYESAAKFSDGVAIAQYDGKYGLLHVVEDKSTFYTKNRRSSQIFSAGGTCTCEFQLAVPDKWKGQAITVTLKDTDTGNLLNLMKKSQNIFSFSYKPSASKAQRKRLFGLKSRTMVFNYGKGRKPIALCSVPS